MSQKNDLLIFVDAFDELHIGVVTRQLFDALYTL